MASDIEFDGPDWADKRAEVVAFPHHQMLEPRAGDCLCDNIAQALREARAEGVEAAAKIVERHCELFEDKGGRSGLWAFKDAASKIRDKAHTGEVCAHDKGSIRKGTEGTKCLACGARFSEESNEAK